MGSAATAKTAPTAGNPAARRLGFTLEPGMTVGLYGGSFHPAHAGHRHVAETALKRIGLDRVIWLVSPQNPLKAAGAEDNLAARRQSARSCARGPRMIVSDAEARLSGRGPRYTVDTVRWFKARFAGVHFVWIMGADNLAQFHRWKGWASLMREIPIAVVSRPGVRSGGRFAPAAVRFAGARLPSTAARRLPFAKPPAWIYLTASFEPVSSSALRNSADRDPQTWYARPLSPTQESPLNRSPAPEALPPEPSSTPAPTDESRHPKPLEAMILDRLDDEKAQDIVFIDLTDKSSVADGLIIASGRSHRHVGAIADHLLRALKDGGHGKARVEGLPSCDWVLIDAGDIVVHLFRPEVRSYYNIEKIWSVGSAHTVDAGAR
jgi:nicotinate-nucleotide adenylyltransferase